MAAIGTHVYVVWDEGSLAFRRSTDGGVTFDSTQYPSPGGGFPELAVNGSNIFVIGEGGSPSDIFFARSTDGGVTFGPSTNLSANASSSNLPQLAVSGANVSVVWSDDAPGNPNIFFRHSADGGETFDAVQNLSDTRGNALHPRVAASGSKIYVVWQDCNPLCFPVDVFFRSSSNDGTSFNPTLNLSEDGGSALPELAVSTSNVYVIWKNFLVGNGDVFFRGTLVPPTNKCPLGQGFWKNHPEAWSVTSLTLGSQSYTQAELLALFDTPPRGDASVILAHQLIAAKLNIANGSNPAPISSTITDADNLLSQFGTNRLPYNVRTSSAIGQQMVNDANVLDRYNNGDLTPDCQP